jgi:hypothetical protein
MTDQEVQLFLARLATAFLPLSLPERIPDDGEFTVRVLSGAGSTSYAPRAARDLQRSPVVYRLPWEDTGAKVIRLGTPRRGWPNGRAGQAEAGRSRPGH